MPAGALVKIIRGPPRFRTCSSKDIPDFLDRRLVSIFNDIETGYAIVAVEPQRWTEPNSETPEFATLCTGAALIPPCGNFGKRPVARLLNLAAVPAAGFVSEIRMKGVTLHSTSTRRCRTAGRSVNLQRLWRSHSTKAGPEEFSDEYESKIFSSVRGIGGRPRPRRTADRPRGHRPDEDHAGAGLLTGCS